MRLRVLTWVAVGFFSVLSAVQADSELQRTVVAARIDASYVAVQKADGSRGLLPIETLTPEDKAWLEALALRSPLLKGKSSVTVVKEDAVIAPKLTIEVSKKENGLETVRLCQPNLMRDQIGGTCMLYARVHWLDIAGYYVNTPDIYKVINHCPTDAPWRSPLYVRALDSFVTTPVPRPLVHRLPPEAEPFAWAREQLRKGRPILAAFPREIWQALPPEFVGSRPWSGGSVGHQIVINGFTHNPATDTGSFHIINSWAELGQFDLDLKAAGGGALVIEASLSPKGEAPTLEEVADSAKTTAVRRVTLVRAAGKVNLYEVETNRGVSRVLAASEAAARTMLEEER